MNFLENHLVEEAYKNLGAAMQPKNEKEISNNIATLRDIAMKLELVAISLEKRLP